MIYSSPIRAMNQAVTPSRSCWRCCAILCSVACLLLCVLAVWRVYHPFRTSFNADDTMLVLQTAYNSIPRDGLMLWTADRTAALHLILAHWLLETLQLKAWVPHAWYLLAQQIVLLLLCTAWLGHAWRTRMIACPLLALLLIAPNDFNPWIVRIGNSYPQMMFAAMLAFFAMLRLERHGDITSALLYCLAATAAMLCSASNIVLVVVWLALLLICHWHDARTCWLRLGYAIVALALACLLTHFLRSLSDTSVHAGRQIVPLRLAVAQWWPTMVRFAHEFARHGLLPSLLMLLGLACGIALLLVACVSVCLRRSWNRASLVRTASMLSVSACVYLIVSAANTWVHLNPLNPQYTVAPYILFIAALFFLLDGLLARLGRWSLLTLTSVATLLLTAVTLVRMPSTPSAQYLTALVLARHTPALGGSVALLGDFWRACESSFVDPHLIVGSDFKGGVMAAVMLPIVLRHPVVLVNGAQAPQHVAPRGILPDGFVQRDFLLQRTTSIPALAAAGWYSYRSCHVSNALAGRNLLSAAQMKPEGLVAVSNDIMRIMATPRGVSQVFWHLGALPRGFYLLQLRARWPFDGGSPLALTSFYVSDYAIESPYPHLEFRAAGLTEEFQTFSQILYYLGTRVPARARLYTWCDAPLELAYIGVYPLMLPVLPQ
jgi:hypothetical protein